MLKLQTPFRVTSYGRCRKLAVRLSAAESMLATLGLFCSSTPYYVPLQLKYWWGVLIESKLPTIVVLSCTINIGPAYRFPGIFTQPTVYFFIRHSCTSMSVGKEGRIFDWSMELPVGGAALGTSNIVPAKSQR